MDETYTALCEAIRDGEEEDALLAAQALLDGGTGPLEIFTDGIEPTLNAMGEEFAALKIFLPDLVMAGDVVKALQNKLEPIMEAQQISGRRKGLVVIATVFGDIHDIGKNMVSLMMQVSGYEVADLGVNIPPVEIAKKAEETGADLVCLSGLMLPSLPYMKETIDLVRGNARLAGVKLMVGGGPLTQQWADAHGADGYSDDAVSAVALADRLMAQKAQRV